MITELMRSSVSSNDTCNPKMVTDSLNVVEFGRALVSTK